MNDWFSAGSNGVWLHPVQDRGEHRVISLGIGMQLYFFDICWDGETVADDEGTSHYDDGCAVYYASTVANRLGRCGRHESVRVHVRDDRNRLLSIVVPRACLPTTAHHSRIREIVERDLARQRTQAAYFAR